MRGEVFSSQNKALSAHSAGAGFRIMVHLFINAVVSGILISGFYAAVTCGVSLSFGILDIVNIAHPAFIILGSYVAYIANATFGIDPIIAAIIATPLFYALGAGIYQIYYVSF